MLWSFLKHFKRLVVKAVRYLITWSVIHDKRRLNTLLIKIHNKVSSRKLKQITLNNFEKQNKVLYSIDSEDHIKIVSPLYMNSNANNILKKSKTIKLFKLKKIFIFPRSSLILNYQKTIAFSDYHYLKPKEADFSDYYIQEANKKFLVYREKNTITKEFNSAFSLLGKGSWNYFHALIEFSPKLYFSQHHINKEIPVLVDEIYKDYPSIQELIEIIGFKNIIYVNNTEMIFVNELYHMSSPFEVTFNKRTKFELEDLEISKNILEYINFIKETLAKKNGLKKEEKYTERIFLKRSNFKIRTYNNSEIETIALKYGFELVDTSRLTLSEQYRIFQNATHIIGPTGASWTNLIFCKEGTKSLTWMNENWGRFPVFSTLSGLLDVDLKYIKTTNCDKDYHGSYYLNPNSFEEALSKILNQT